VCLDKMCDDFFFKCITLLKHASHLLKNKKYIFFIKKKSPHLTPHTQPHTSTLDTTTTKQFDKNICLLGFLWFKQTKFPTVLPATNAFLIWHLFLFFGVLITSIDKHHAFFSFGGISLCEIGNFSSWVESFHADYSCPLCFFLYQVIFWIAESSNNVLKKKKEGFHERKREVACWP